MPGIADKQQYWNDVALEWGHARPDFLWRKHSDQVNLALLAGWLPDNPVQRLLKTDLFDEAVGEGLLLFLHTRAHHVVGMDIAIMTLRMAHLPYGKSMCTDVRRLPFANDSFDVVLSKLNARSFSVVGRDYDQPA